MTHDVRLWLYPGANPDSDPAGWGLEADISAYIRRPGSDGGQAITYSGGKGDEAPGVDAGQMQLTLDNRDGRFSTDNALGPYYRLLDINNPIRMGVVSAADAFTRAASASGWGGIWTHGTAAHFSTTGTSGQWTAPSANLGGSALAASGDARDVDIRVKVTPTAVSTGSRISAGIQVRRTSGSDYLRGTLGFDLAGAMTIDIARITGGVNTYLAELSPWPSTTYTAGQQWTMRLQADGQAIRFKAWPTATSEPAAWTLTATDSTKNSTGVGLYTARFSGNTNSGVTPCLTFDDFEAVALEFTGSVVSWPVRWDRSGNNSWTPITAAGILRRLRQGVYPIQSPLRRQLAGTPNVTGYWPMEDGPDATRLYSAIPGQAGARFVNASPATNNDLAGGGVAPTLDTDAGFITMNTVKSLSGSGFSAMFFFKLGNNPSSKTKVARIQCTRGNGPRTWDFYVSNTTAWVEGINADGAVAESATNAHGEDWTEWHAWQFETEFIGGSTINWAGIFHRVGSTDFGAQTGSFSGVIAQTANTLTLTGPQGSAFAHAWIGLNTLPFVDTNFSLVSSGYVGETAAERFARNCREAGLPYILRPGASERMGAQREAGLLAVLESCVQTDYGVMAERGSGLEYIPREARWNAAVAMALTVAAGQIADAPEPTRDDQRLRNKWTVSRVGGGEGVYQDDADIAKHGTWEDSASVNTMDDSVLVAHAGFRTALGIVQRMRWPAVALDFARNSTLLPAWRARGYGWRLQVTTGKAQVAGNEPDLIVEGFTATLDPDRWNVVLNCSPAEAWVAAVTDDTGILGRADNEYCQTTALISSTTLSIPITTTSGTRWDNTAGLWTGGVDFWVDGERVTVTSITNGTNPAQTLNCTARGVGGYQASHPSGSKVRLWNPPVVAL